MRPSPYQITAFTMTARERSFSAAARSLDVSQSAVTQHVAKLEQMMGTPLFIRRREGLDLTRAGRELFELSDRLRTMEELVVERIGDYGDLATGQLKIGANAPRPAMPIISDFVTRFPKVEISLELMSWDLVMRRLKDRDLDVGFVVAPNPTSDLVTTRIGTTKYRAFVHRDHHLAGRKRLSLLQLSRETVIVPEDGSLTQRVLNAKLAEHDIQLSSVIKSATFPMVKEAVLHNAGVGLMLSDGQYPSANLVEIPVTEMSERYPIEFVFPKDRRDLKLVRSFHEVVLDAVM